MQFDEIILENLKDLENRESENENLLSSKIIKSDKTNENLLLPKDNFETTKNGKVKI